MIDNPNTSLIPDTHVDLFANEYAGLLTTVRHTDGMLSTNPVSVHWIEDTVKISTLKSRMKYRNVLADPRVVVCIMSPEDRMHYIEIRGTATVEDDADRSFHDTMFEKVVGMPPPEDMDPPGAERVVIVVKPEQISHPSLYGGRFNDNNQSGR